MAKCMYCSKKAYHHDEEGIGGCCEHWPLAFEGEIVPDRLRCYRCRKLFDSEGKYIG